MTIALTSSGLMKFRNTIQQMDQLQIRRENGTAADVVVLRLTGPLIISNLFEFQEICRETGSAHVIVDLADVPYIDSAGLGSILAHWSHTQRHGRKFALTGVSPRIDTLLEITKVKSVLPGYATVAEAEAAFGGSGQAHA